MIYFLTTICFYTIFTSTGIPNNSSEDEKVIAGIMGVVIIALDLYFLYYEFAAIIRNVSSYLTEDIFNYVDLFTAALNLYLVFETLTEKES